MPSSGAPQGCHSAALVQPKTLPREKLEGCLQHAARQESKSDRTDDAPVAFGSPGAEPWMPGKLTRSDGKGSGWRLWCPAKAGMTQLSMPDSQAVRVDWPAWGPWDSKVSAAAPRIFFASPPRGKGTFCITPLLDCPARAN